MLSAIDTGLFKPGAVSVDFECPTGNCTFAEAYSTIGYFATCSDLSGQLNYSVQTLNDGAEVLVTSLPSGLQVSLSPVAPGFTTSNYYLVLGKR